MTNKYLYYGLYTYDNEFNFWELICARIICGNDDAMDDLDKL